MGNGEIGMPHKTKDTKKKSRKRVMSTHKQKGYQEQKPQGVRERWIHNQAESSTDRTPSSGETVGREPSLRSDGKRLLVVAPLG